MAARFRCCRCLVQHIAMLLKHRLQSVSKTFCVILLLLMVPLGHAAKIEDFMPKESVLYLKLQDLDEVYSEIEISENWEKALALLPEISDWQEMQQGLAMLQGMLGTSPLGIIETVGYRTALAVWFEEANDAQIGIVIHSGGNLNRLQQFTKIVEGFLGMDTANTLHLDAGVYQRVRYNALERFNSIVKYGFVEDFLVIGIGDESFEKLMDTYRTDLPSIQQNPEFTEVLAEMGSGEVIVFANVPPILPVIDLAEWERRNLAIFQSVFGRLNFLETGPFLQVTAQFTPDLPENEIGLFLKEGQRLETLNALSGEEDLFVAVAPQIVEGVWELGLTEMEKNATKEAHEAISFLEGHLNLNLEGDIRIGLTGELALSVSDLTRFNLESINNINLDTSFELDASGVETNGCLIFNPSHRMKWNQMGNSLSNSLSHLQNVSISQTDYKDVTVSTVSGYDSSVYYSEINGLFLIGFEEDQVCALIDSVKQKKKPSYLKHLPKTPTAFAQLNLARSLVIGRDVPVPDKHLVDFAEIPPSFAVVAVEDDKLLLQITLSEKETPLEVCARLAPLYFWRIQTQPVQNQ